MTVLEGRTQLKHELEAFKDGLPPIVDQQIADGVKLQLNWEGEEYMEQRTLPAYILVDLDAIQDTECPQSVDETSERVSDVMESLIGLFEEVYKEQTDTSTELESANFGDSYACFSYDVEMNRRFQGKAVGGMGIDGSGGS